LLNFQNDENQGRCGYETQLLSPLLAEWKKNPYSVPEGFLANFGENLKNSATLKY
jgi:hypothetical protein